MPFAADSQKQQAAGMHRMRWTDRRLLSLSHGEQAGPRFIVLLVVAALVPWPLLLGPDNWWAFLSVTAAMAVTLRRLLGPEWASYAGLKLPPAHSVMTVAAFVVIALGSQRLLEAVYATAGLRANAPGIAAQAGFLSQALNEEILLRALLIGLLLLYVRSALLISLALGLVFAAVHFLLYRYSNPMHLALSFYALASLFFAGVAMNNLYLAFRHIGFSWALHAGWNVVWLPAAVYDSATHQPLNEPQLFDRVLGAPMVVLAAGAAAILSFAVMVAARGGNKVSRSGFSAP